MLADCNLNKSVPAEGTRDVQLIPVDCMDFQEELIKKIILWTQNWSVSLKY